MKTNAVRERLQREHDLVLPNSFYAYLYGDALTLIDELLAERATARSHLRAFVSTILHGDDRHQQWLLDECEKFIEKYVGDAP